MLEQGISTPKTTIMGPESLSPAVDRKCKPCMFNISVASPHVFCSAGIQKLNLPVAPSVGPQLPLLVAFEPPLQAIKLAS